MDKPMVKNGIILAIVSIIFTMVVYLTNPANLTAGWILPVSLVISIFFMVKSIREFKAMNGGYASYGEALVQAFGTAVIGTLIASIFSWVLYNVIDPGLADVVKQSMIEKFESMESFVGEEAAEQMIEGLEDQDMTMTVGKLLQGVAFSAIFSLIVSLIVAAFTKKNNDGIGA